jgi:hypothetical protein
MLPSCAHDDPRCLNPVSVPFDFAPGIRVFGIFPMTSRFESKARSLERPATH